GYVSDARIAYATDIWSPGAAPLPDKLSPPLAALVAGVKKAGITPAKFAGGHGGGGGYAPPPAPEGKEARRAPGAGPGGRRPSSVSCDSCPTGDSRPIGYSGPLANQSCGSAARTRASGRPSSRRTMLVPSTSETHL